MTSPSELMARLQVALGEQYRLERELGHGGMGVVFLATDTTLDRPVAVKVVHPELSVHPSITQRFLAEARMIARLRHPNIVTVHTAGETTGLFFYVMDYVPGESLRQRMTREQRLPVAEVLRVIGDLTAALEAAGRAGLVHRDVKPENVLLDSGGNRALLADFGIARAMALEGSSGITAQGIAVGTPTYMSPEQAAGEAVDARSDLYSLGVVGYEMLAGRPPFVGSTSAAVAAMHLSELPRPIQEVRPDTPPGLAAAIMRSLAKNPADRWQTGEDFRRALTSSGGAAGRHRRRWVIATAALLAAGLVSVTVATRRANGPPAGVNPRHSILVLPFDNVRQDPTVQWLREGSVNMLALNLSQWNDLTVVDHERLHDLLAKLSIKPGDPIGLETARRLARAAGVWTVVLGDFIRAGDSLHLSARVFDVGSGARVDIAQVGGRPGEDMRPMFDQLAAKLLDLSGAPNGIQTGVANATTASIEAYRAYLTGVEKLNQWDLAGAERDLDRAIAIDSTFGLAYYKLALTRGWIAGQNDSVSASAIALATQHSSHVPVHERAMISAYRSFVQGDYPTARRQYTTLLGRDSTDADAWYGLADVSFHDTTDSRRAELWTQSLRAFKRTLTLDPNYYLAYEHITQILNLVSRNDPFLALLPGDSLVRLWSRDGVAQALDSSQVRQAVQRARAEGITTARNWTLSQPENPHAQNAVIQSLVASQNYSAALSEVDRLQASPLGVARPDLPFVRVRIQLAAGDLAGARTGATKALDSASAEAFIPGALSHDAAWREVSTAANALVYAGQLKRADQAITLAGKIQERWYPNAPGSRHIGDNSAWTELLRSHIYAAAGAPTPVLRELWHEIAEAAREVPSSKRGEIAQWGWPAALGLFIGEAGDATPLKELNALMEDPPPPEIRALQALEKKDTAGALRLLRSSDSGLAEGYKSTPQWFGYRTPIAAQAYFALGDYQKAVALLDDFDPRKFSAEGLDVRWGLLGRVRLLRAAAYEKLGRLAEAKREYRLVLEQWEGADPALQPYLKQARLGMARVSGAG